MYICEDVTICMDVLELKSRYRYAYSGVTITQGNITTCFFFKASIIRNSTAFLGFLYSAAHRVENMLAEFRRT